MKAKDLMTRNVVTLLPGNSVRHAARMMIDNDISGLPVIDDSGALVGMLTEGDLLGRTELGLVLRGAGEAPLAERARGHIKAQGLMVGDVMSPGAIAFAEEAPATKVAALLDEHAIRRIPVTRDGRLVGIVSRRDLLRLVADARLDPALPGDAAIARAVSARLGEDASLETADISVSVDRGVVELRGTVALPIQKNAARVIAESVRGVTDVVDHLQVAAKQNSMTQTK